jgi:PleD family two-component response regulator
MDDVSTLIELAEEIFQETTGNYLSELQRLILVASLTSDRKTYEEIADECGYSSKYVKQDVAPKLWKKMSEVFQEKVNKSNIKAILNKKYREKQESASPQSQLNPQLVQSVSSVSHPSSLFSSEGTSKGNLLLVDDQPQNLSLLSELLEEQGYDVREAINGELALQTANVKPPDLILLDINMPDLDGYTVCQRLKGNPKTQDIPVMFISALDEAWDKVKGFSVGGVDYITKPFKAIEVIARVENHLKMGQLKKELIQKNLEIEHLKQQLAKYQ